MLEFILLCIIFYLWGTSGPKTDMLPNGCIPEGHRFDPRGMCKVCGHYE